MADLQQIRAEISTTGEKSIRETLDARQSQELVLAFAGPIGCGTGQVVAEAKLALESVGYEVHVIKLSQIIETALGKETVKLDANVYNEYSSNVRRIMRLQDGGNELRKISSSYLAEHAIEEIVVQRGHQKGLGVEPQDYIPIRTAYLIDQIKHPDEVSMLRIVYRKLFHLIGVISVAEKRRSRLLNIDRAASAISELMERDRRQEDDNGQQLDKALKLADFFISTDAGTTSSLQRKLRRFIGLLHGENGITPTTQEYGMYAAYSAGLKSACLSRQVGAAISDVSGKIVSTGCNDVPKATGGLYSAEDGTNDRRCVHREEQICFNDQEKLSHKADIRRALEELKQKQDEDVPLIPKSRLDDVLTAVFKASHIGDLTEFSRAVHAEMDAIISLARTGTPGIVGAHLFTTTFPCHSCARHIVAAGIDKVYYIEPYEKSLAKKLHADAIEFETEDDDVEKAGYSARPVRSLVKFVHFEGVAPKQYLHFFQMTKRKDEITGNVIKIMPKDAPKAVSEYLDNYREFEAKVVQKLKNAVPALKAIENPE
ncbi:deoxycytidylate deaminase [Collimonas sp. PA-H2]|uniref:anti-phage dCTP deaminase n=1 Tax=Collimonas sp. PA-H2 TaxID=1881062 RepID=UPI000BF63F9C|nr:anti-phage dCTP deaminase [Collimonas sp. PA-H2]PFH10133.1 deoxycytidylate deaminase [Collimonas sp. PA-H2]